MIIKCKSKLVEEIYGLNIEIVKILKNNFNPSNVVSYDGCWKIINLNFDLTEMICEIEITLSNEIKDKAIYLIDIYLNENLLPPKQIIQD